MISDVLKMSFPNFQLILYQNKTELKRGVQYIVEKQWKS